MQYYQDQYERFPKAIAQAAKDSLLELKLTAEASVKASAETTKADLAEAVATTAKEVAYNTSRKQMWQWAGGCIGIAFLCFSMFGWFIHSKAYTAGYNSGYGIGYSEAKDEKAAATWANTPEGKLAYRFAQLGELPKLAKCEGKGWEIEKGICYVQPVKEGTYGWRIITP